jgi:hypothetical protein
MILMERVAPMPDVEVAVLSQSLRVDAYRICSVALSSGATMIDFKGSQFERDIILWGVHWYVAHPISYRQFEEIWVSAASRSIIRA